MARYDKARKGATRARLIDSAARRFRGEGIDGVGIATLMAEAGLTNGAFYAHFASKEELVAQAVLKALVDFPVGLGLGDGDLRRFIDAYLSPAHRNDVATGCALAALAPDIQRRPEASRAAFEAEGAAMMQAIADRLPDTVASEDRLHRAVAVFAHLLGSLQLARFVADRTRSDAILAEGRQHARRIAGFPDG